MKTKTTALLLSLVLSFGFFLQQSVAVSPSGLPASGDDSQNGMNLNFSGAASFPQTADTFAPLTETLEDAVADDEPPCVNPLVFTKRDALENTAAENSITIAQGQWIKIDLGKEWIEGVYSSNENGYDFENPWSLQQDAKNLKPIMGGWDNEGARPVVPPKKQWSRITEKYGVYYCLYATAAGETTLTFTYHSRFSTAPKNLTFRFNVVEASAVPAPSEDWNFGSIK